MDTVNKKIYGQPQKLNRQQRRNLAKKQKKLPPNKPVKQQPCFPNKPPTVMYECDPLKHVNCSKKNCFINGGPCHQTKQLEFARQPVQKAHMVMPVDEELHRELMSQYAKEFDDAIKQNPHFKQVQDLAQTSELSEEAKKNAGLA